MVALNLMLNISGPSSSPISCGKIGTGMSLRALVAASELMTFFVIILDVFHLILALIRMHCVLMKSELY